MIIRRYFLKVFGWRIRLVFYSLPNNTKSELEKSILKLYQNFISASKKKCDFTITFYIKKVEFFSDKNQKNIYSTHLFFFDKKKREIKTTIFISLAQFNEIFLRFVVSYLLEKNQGFFIHASANIFKKALLIFMGPSSAGKTTITNIFNRSGFPSVADDGIFIIPNRHKRDEYLASILNIFEKKNYLKRFSRIFKKEQRIKISQSMFKIKKIFLLKKSNENKIIPLTKTPLLLKKIFENFYSIGYFDKKESFTSFIRFTKRYNFFLLFFKKTRKVDATILKNLD